jgi:hypothetical protein
MKSSLFAMLMCAFVTLPAFAQDPASPGTATASVTAVKGEMVIAPNGGRLGRVYRTGADGSAQIFIDGRLVTLPASTLSNSNGKLTTSLTKSELLAVR